jgi:DNA-binding NarL/FixJ family response regulator
MCPTDSPKIADVPPAAAKSDGKAKRMELSSPAEASARWCGTVSAAIALIDPMSLTRQSIVEMLAKGLPEYLTVPASSCEELLKTLGTASRPRLVIVYIRAAGVMAGWVKKTLGLVRLRMAGAPVIVLSDRDDADDIHNALTCGVRGYIPVSVGVADACAALRVVHEGGIYIPKYALRSAPADPETPIASEGRSLLDDLTPRELEVIHLLRGEGKSNKKIATELNMQESTVKVHVRSIMRKLAAANRTHAASIANQLTDFPS